MIGVFGIIVSIWRTLRTRAIDLWRHSSRTEDRTMVRFVEAGGIVRVETERIFDMTVLYCTRPHTCGCGRELMPRQGRTLVVVPRAELIKGAKLIKCLERARFEVKENP